MHGPDRHFAKTRAGQIAFTIDVLGEKTLIFEIGKQAVHGWLGQSEFFNDFRRGHGASTRPQQFEDLQVSDTRTAYQIVRIVLHQKTTLETTVFVV